MKKPPSKLSSVPDLQHAIYVADITIWSFRGSPSTQKRTIQDGLDNIRVLEMVPGKSERVGVQNQGRKQTGVYPALNGLTANGQAIPRHSHIRILVLIRQQVEKAECGPKQSSNRLI